MAMSRKMLVLAFAAAVLLRHSAFVPPPRSMQPVRPALPLTAAAGAGAAAILGAAPAYADNIDLAAAKLSRAAYPFLKEVDWNSALSLTKPSSASATDFVKAIDKAIVMGAAMDTQALKAGVLAHHKAIEAVDKNGLTTDYAFQDILASIGKMVASVPEDKVMDVYRAFGQVVSSQVPEYLMSKVNKADAQKAYEGFMEFKDVVKANPITPAKDPLSLGLVVSAKPLTEAAKKLSTAAYPFVKDIDWSSNLALTPPGPTATPQKVLQAIDKALLMGAAMDGSALKEAALAHSKAIGSIDSKGVTSAADFEAINIGLAKAIASVPASKTMDVYNAFSKVVSPDVPKYLMASVKEADAKAAYQALMTFKDVVKAESLAQTFSSVPNAGGLNVFGR